MILEILLFISLILNFFSLILLFRKYFPNFYIENNFLPNDL